MLLLLTICIVMIDMMASIKLTVKKLDGEEMILTIEEGEYTAKQILEKVYGDKVDVDMYRLIYRGKLQFDGSRASYEVYVVASSKHHEFDLMLPTGKWKSFSIGTPSSKHVRVDTLLSMHQFDPSEYCLVDEKTRQCCCDDDRVSGPQTFMIERKHATPQSGDEHQLIVNIDGRQIKMPSDGTAVDLLRIAGIYPPTHSVRFDGAIIPMHKKLSDCGVCDGAKLDAISVQTVQADILIESVRRDRGCDQSTIDLMRLDCDAQNKRIWLNGGELRDVKKEEYDEENWEIYYRDEAGDAKKMKIIRFHRGQIPQMKECLRKHVSESPHHVEQPVADADIRHVVNQLANDLSSGCLSVRVEYQLILFVFIVCLLL